MRLSWEGRRVFVTGHTGFKGGWLATWLVAKGAKVTGYSLNPPTQPSFFDDVGRHLEITDVRGDLRDMEQLRLAMNLAEPDVVLHLAAQALVDEGYRDPVGTFTTNIGGTVNLLESVRNVPSVRAVIIVTTDKVYKNHGDGRYYQEDDPLGGVDPYSASKAATEILVACYRASFLQGNGDLRGVRIATARAGNVIGGGDWAAGRLIPDCVRAFSAGRPVKLRAPGAVRPWQHVLEALNGYLMLAEELLTHQFSVLEDGWNFGPSRGITVSELAETAAGIWGGDARVDYDSIDLKSQIEHYPLRLDSTKSHTHLNWDPQWTVEEALIKTIAWYRSWALKQDMVKVTRKQIEAFESGVADESV